MQPKMHCKVDGKLFAAVMDRQNTAISFTFKVAFPGLTLESTAVFSAPVVPGKSVNKLCYQSSTSIEKLERFSTTDVMSSHCTKTKHASKYTISLNSKMLA